MTQRADQDPDPIGAEARSIEELLINWRASEALPRARQFAADHPGDRRATPLHGRALLATGHFDECEQVLDGAVPWDRPELRVLAVRCALARREPEVAWERSASLEQIAPEVADRWIAISAAATGRDAEAVARVAAAYESDTEAGRDTDAQVNLLWAASGRPGCAERAVALADELEAENELDSRARSMRIQARDIVTGRAVAADVIAQSAFDDQAVPAAVRHRPLADRLRRWLPRR